VLKLSTNGIGAAGASALIDSPLLAQLDWLALEGNTIREELISRLRERLGDRLTI
jgi:hypothetical protein